MMTTRRRTLALVGAALWVGGCLGGSATEAPDGPSLSVNVAALNLQGVGDVVWDVEVRNGADPAQVVWQRRLSSSGYGDGAGSASYVGPCDADPGANQNKVRVWVVGVYSGPVTALGAFSSGAAGGATGSAINFNNPTGDGTPLEKSVLCTANADATVQFDVSLARPAEQGFFDVAVSFEDIFCSAKLDCEDDAGDDLDLLHTASGDRDMTAVLGFACTASPTGTTFLYMNDPKIVCAGQAPLAVVVDAAGQGNVDFGQAPSANAGSYLFAASVYRGIEGLANKAYWNISFGLDATKFAALGTCTLTGRATASKQALPQEADGFPLPEGTVYPVIDWSVQLSDATGRVCGQHEANADGSGVATTYVGYMAAPNQLSWQTEVIYLDNRFEPLTGIVLKKAGVPTGFACTGTVCANATTGEVWVPEGDFWMGCNSVLDANCSTDESAQHLVTLSSYAIDSTEVTAAAYRACVTAGGAGCTVPGTTGGTYGTYDPGVSKQDHPANYVDWNMASAYCAWNKPGAGVQRLCTEAEWEKAARGGCDTVTGDCTTGAQMRKYPWDAGDGSAAVEPSGCTQANWSGCSVATYTSPVGSYPAGASPYGTLDMSGNVWEWVYDWYGGSYAAGAVTDPTGPGTGSHRAGRGGGFDPGAAGVRASRRSSYTPGSAYYSFGFRCCRSSFCTLDTDCAAGEICSASACIDDPCDPDPCQNGGTCSANGTSYTCGCVDGYTGTDCETPPSPSGFACTGTVCENATTGEVWVPEGDFWMGCNSALDASCNPDESDQHLVTLSSYAIDRTEVTASAYAACVATTACSAASSGTDMTYGVSGKEQHPINGVNKAQATAYCAWAGKAAGAQRLCTEAEWERAARGGCETVVGGTDPAVCMVRMRTYPWDAGDNTAPTAPTCALANFYGGAGGTTYCEPVTHTAAADSRPDGASPYGALNMAGNLWEWVSDWYAYPYASTAVTDPTGPGNVTGLGVVRGGYFGDAAAALRCSRRLGDHPTNALYFVGFRCCRSL